MLIVIKKNIFSLAEVWFDADIEEVRDVDVVFYRQRTNPINNIGCDECYTRLIDLKKSHEELWESISKNDKYKIKRAGEKDHIVYEYWDQISYDILEKFADFYDSFAAQKGLVKINRSILQNRANAGVLDISHIKSQDGEPLIWHGYYRSKERIYLLHSASIKNPTDTSYQSMLGRANIYHHWQDIVRFKKSGISTYDFGGWYTGDTDKQKLGINHFKEKFGGEIVRNFNCTHVVSNKGKLYSLLQNILKKKT